MSLICGGVEALPFEDVAQVAVTLGASHLCPDHSKRLILMDHQCTGNGLVECGPSTVGVELGQSLVQWLVARHTFVNSGARRCLVVLTRVWCLGSQLSEHTKLLWSQNGLPLLFGLGHDGSCESEIRFWSSNWPDFIKTTQHRKAGFKPRVYVSNGDYALLATNLCSEC